jgi:hypothetical protein
VSESETGTKLHPKREADSSLKCPKVVHKDMNKLIREAWDHGAHCVASGKNHVKVWPVDGSRMISIPSTPSSPAQTYRNKLRALQRAGLAE